MGASNSSYAVDGSYLRVNASAKNKGLCPHLKYHAFYAWMFICVPVGKRRGSDRENQKKFGHFLSKKSKNTNKFDEIWRKG